MKRLVMIAATLGGLLIGCGRHAEPSRATPPQTTMQVQVATAERQQRVDHYVATGTVRGRTTAVLTSKAMGQVKKLHVQAGDDVERGQLLVELDARDAKASLAEARAAIAQAEASIARADSDLQGARVDREMAELTWHRIEKLAAQDAVTDQERDQTDKALDAARVREQTAEAITRAARSQLQQARASREVAAAHLGDREVRAPFSGRVVQRSVNVGDLAAPGTPLLTIEDVTRLRAEAFVDESQAGHVRLGQSASVTVDAAQVQAVGVVAEIVPAVDVASRAFVVKVDIPLSAAAERMQTGMFARVEFSVGERERLVVPRQALSRRGPLERVFVIEDGRARLRLVTTGSGEGDDIEVLSGLSPGETVVVGGPIQLADATPVEPKQ